MYRKYGSVIINTAFRMIIPFYLLYAIYVLIHGHYSPGGGFQAGVILAISIILVRMIEGQDSTWGLNRRATIICASLGTFIFAGIGILATFFGGSVLNYGVLPLGEVENKVRAMGTLGIEIGVTLAVMGVFILIYDLLTGREETSC